MRVLAPKERGVLIIELCRQPMYREQIREEYREALERGGQTPHVMEKAFSLQTKLAENCTMLERVVELV